MNFKIRFLNRDPKKIIWIDCFGALLTAVCLGLVLPALPQYFHSPKMILYAFSVYAFVISVVSFSNLKWKFIDVKKHIALLIVVNSLYLVLTSLLLLTQSHSPGSLDSLYFSLEILLILFLIGVETIILKAL